MTARERALAALELRPVDRVPVGEFVIDPNVIAGMDPSYEDAVDVAAAEGLDLIGAMARFETVHRYDDGRYTDEWGCTYKPTPDFVAHPIQGPVTTDTNLSKLTLPDPNAPHRLGGLEALVAKAAGRFAINFHSRVAFMWSVYLMGMDGLLMAMYTHPDFVHDLLARVADANLRVIRRAIRAGADSISLGDDYCGSSGPIMSPDQFREFILPHFSRAVDVIHEEGAKCIKHCDGDLWPILDDMVDAGIDGLNPLEPVANMDVAEVKDHYGNRICLLGNIDCAQLLPHGTPDEVEEAVRECIAKGASDGTGLIVTSSNSIHSGVRPDNYRAMIQAVHKHGQRS